MAGPIWLVSYPKSGNTWLRLLLANLLSDRDGPADINDPGLPACNLVNRIDVEDMTLVDTHLLTREECDRLRPTLMAEAWRAAVDRDVFIKLHDAYRRLDDGTPVLGHRAARAAIYLLRDPRDVVVSLAHHDGHTVDEAVRRIRSGDTHMGGQSGARHTQIVQPLLDWSGHVRSWTRQCDVPVHVLRYEDLLADTGAVFGRVAAFLDLPAAPELVGRAARHAGFDELRRQETAAGFRERHAGSTAPFFRSGQAGGWRTALTREQAAAIEAAHGEVMAAFGYL